MTGMSNDKVPKYPKRSEKLSPNKSMYNMPDIYTKRGDTTCRSIRQFRASDFVIPWVFGSFEHSSFLPFHDPS